MSSTNQDDATKYDRLDDVENDEALDELYLENDEEEDELEYDPLSEKIEAYLDDEMPTDERDEFERQLENDPELKARVEQEREAWDALDLLDVDVSFDVVESTVEQLNSETQAELLALDRQGRRQRVAIFAATVVSSALLVLAGYFLFSFIFPDINTLRERDYKVVDRLIALEAVGSFEYLVELERSKVLLPPSVGVQDQEAKPIEFPTQHKSYQELSQDRTFLRNQQRFESLDKTEQQELRALYAQIDTAPNAAALWGSAFAYAFWLATATSSSEREQLASQPIPERIRTIRKKQEFFKQLHDFYVAAANMRNQTPQWGERPSPQNGGAPRPFGPSWQRRPENVESPVAAAIRVSLPNELRDEDLSKVYQKFQEYQRAGHKDDDVIGFLNSVDKQELVGLTSDDAQKFLKEQSPDALASTLGLLVTLSYLENNRAPDPFGGERRAGQPTPNDRPRPQLGGPNMVPNNMRAQGGFDRNMGFNGGQNANFGMNAGAWFPGSNTIGALAETLKTAPDGAKDYIFSNPPQAAWQMLLGLHWRVGQNRGFSFERRDGGANDRRPNNPWADPGPRDPRNNMRER